MRQVVNVVNLSTPLGLLAALAGRARVSARAGRPAPGEAASGSRCQAPAFTLGNVVLIRIDDEALARRPPLLRARGPARDAVRLLPRAGDAAALRAGRRCGRGCGAGDPSSYNVFEVRAGLADGGYPTRDDRPNVA